MEYAAYLRIVPFAAQNHAANTPSLHGGLQDVHSGIAHTAGSTIDKITISDICIRFCVFVCNHLMEYAAYLRIVPFATQNHTANTPSLHGCLQMSFAQKDILPTP